MNSIVKITDLHKSFKASTVFQNFNLEIGCNDFVSIIGPTGCGKTTILDIISKLDTIYLGNISWSIEKSEISYLFQDSILLPWLSLYENISLPMKIAGKNNYKENVLRILKDVDLVEFKDHFPHQLSGGMQRRAALACVLITNPRLLLLDEPMTGLDFLTKESILKLISNVCSRENLSVVMTTHYIDDAIQLSTRLVLISKDVHTYSKEITIHQKNNSFLDFDNCQKYEDSIKQYYKDQHNQALHLTRNS